MHLFIGYILIGLVIYIVIHNILVYENYVAPYEEWDSDELIGMPAMAGMFWLILIPLVLIYMICIGLNKVVGIPAKLIYNKLHKDKQV